MANIPSWFHTLRGRVALVTLGILILLDVGRSLYARVGYAAPAEPWQEAPYQAIAWPPGSDVSAETPVGRKVYIERCALCHGPDGRGDGPAAPSLIPRPRDFTLGLYKYKSTPGAQPPSDDDLTHLVRDGLQASAMPYWRDILSDEEIAAVVDYIQQFSTLFDAEPQPIAIPERIAPDEASLARGATLYQVGCASCHGGDGRARLTLADSKGYPVIARDLTAPWTFRGGSTPDDLWLRITTGLAPGPMPPFADQWSPEARWDVANYVLSLARTPPWEPGGALDGPGHQTEPQKRGEYLVHLEMCGLCHTQVNAAMIYSGDQYYLAGGMGVPAYPQGTFVSRNLTPDPESGLGNWTVEEIANAIRNGKAKDRYLNFWGMPWMFLHAFEQEDALAIATYLKSRPPVTNRIPLPLKYGFIETVIAKTFSSQGLPPLGNPDVLTYKAGNYGQTHPGPLRDWPQQALIWLQWFALEVGIIVYIVTGFIGKSQPRNPRRWGRIIFATLGFLILGFLLWLLYSTPVLPMVPPQIISQGATSGIHHPDPAQFATVEEAALAARGEYLFRVTSCAFCHNVDGRGGAKINMAAFGTLWTRNISSDVETGIGAWTDAEIARAIRSGVGRNGRPLHWQGMIWDHLSNLDEEDVRALIVYLRALPPVRSEIPDPVPPSADDCEEYTFFLVDSWTPGCAR